MNTTPSNPVTPQTTPDQPVSPTFPGTLRDWFAGQALAGMLASGDFDFEKLTQSSGGVTGLSYTIADDMLKTREGEQ